MYVHMVFSETVVRDHSCGGLIALAGQWHEKVAFPMKNHVGRVALTDL